MPLHSHKRQSTRPLGCPKTPEWVSGFNRNGCPETPGIRTWHRWKAQYGGMKANDAKRLKELETENGRLKRIVADLTLDNAMLKEVAKGNF